MAPLVRVRRLGQVATETIRTSNKHDIFPERCLGLDKVKYFWFAFPTS